MNKKIIIAVIWYLLIGSFVGNNSIKSQVLEKSNYKYISPVPNSKYIMPDNNIALRHGERIDEESLQNFGIMVSGSESGRIEGKIQLSDDARTVIYKPNNPYFLGEKIQVEVSEGLKTETGLIFEPLVFSFTITSSIPDLPGNYFIDKELGSSIPQENNKYSKKNNKAVEKNNNLPDDFPLITVNLSKSIPDEGFYFVAPLSTWGLYPDATPYLIIMDKYGTPVFYRKNPGAAYDFKKMVDGNLVYYANYNNLYRWIVENDKYEEIDFYTIENGYPRANWHEFQMLPNGHVFLMASDPQIVGMDTVVPGGHPFALVIGLIVQELDTDRNVVFQWRSWDHYLITDAHEHVDLTDLVIDPIHGNAIEAYSDNSLLLSPRNLNEITKIDRNTGDIIWRLGGENNMFDFVNDTLGFSMQHDCRWLENGNISLFDNGTYHPEPKFSSIIEYEINDNDYTATLVNRYRNDPDALGIIMGNGQEAESGNFIAGWGSSGEPAITEFDTNGDVLAEISIESINYRAYRFPWESHYFLLEKDTLQYGYIWQENVLTKNLEVYNNSDQEIQLTSYYSMNDAFTIENDFPVSITEGESKNLKVKFSPGEVGLFEGMITVNSDINSDTLVQRIAQQVYVVGNATEGQGDNDLMDEVNVYLYPNPVDKELILKFSSKEMYDALRLHNIYGQILIERPIDNKEKVVVNLEKLPSGIYFVYLNKSNNTGNQCYKIIKN